MMGRMQRLFTVVVLTFTACGPSANHGSTTPTAESDATCQQEVPTGSTLDKKVCRTEAQKEEQRKAAQDLYQDPPRYRPGNR
jgi:hypothetical protein